MTLTQKLGVEPQKMIELIQASMVKNGVVDYKAPFVLRRDYSPNFPLRLMHKDIHLMLDMAKEKRIKLPALETVDEIYEMSSEEGWDDLDYAATFGLLEKWAGIGQKEVIRVPQVSRFSRPGSFADASFSLCHPERSEDAQRSNAVEGPLQPATLLPGCPPRLRSGRHFDSGGQQQAACAEDDTEQVQLITSRELLVTSYFPSAWNFASDLAAVHQLQRTAVHLVRGRSFQRRQHRLLLLHHRSGTHLPGGGSGRELQRAFRRNVASDKVVAAGRTRELALLVQLKMRRLAFARRSRRAIHLSQHPPGVPQPGS